MFEPYEECSDEELRVAYVELGALERAVHAHRLAVLAVLDQRQAWREDGATDTAAWVTATDGVFRATAVDQVEAARALAVLPAIAAVAASGRLSPDQLGQVIKVAIPETDEQWAADAPGLSAPQLRRLAAAHHRVHPADAAAHHRRRSLSWWTDHRSGMVRLTGRLTPDAGAIVTNALNHLAGQAGPGPDGRWEPFAARCADALTQLATATAGQVGIATLVLHATPDALDPDGIDVPTLDDGNPLSVLVARRLACDAHLVVETPDGVMRLGRSRRIANHHQRRRLTHRDPTCRFPGCDRDRWLQIHHLIHWADGGVTDEDHLLHLCSQHHRFVHDHAWTVTGDPTRPDGLVFHRPDGHPYQPGPTAVRSDLLHRCLGPPHQPAA